MKASTEATDSTPELRQQCEVFYNKNSSNGPKLTISWTPKEVEKPSKPEGEAPVDVNLLTVDVLPLITKKEESNILHGVYVYGYSAPNSKVTYSLVDVKNNKVLETEEITVGEEMAYPDTSLFGYVDAEPEVKGTANWQSNLLKFKTQLKTDTIYRIDVKATAKEKI